MTHYDNGRRFEYRVAHELADDGYETIRAAGSKGKVDLVAMKPGELLFIQCKRTNGTLRPSERLELRRLAELVAAHAIVAHQPKPRGPIAYRRLTGQAPDAWVTWTPDAVHTTTQLQGGMQ